MRYPKFLINAFATLGVVSFIFLACSVTENVNDDTVVIDDDENPPIENNYGKYQISTNISSSNSIYTTILNTETGQVKLYRSNENQSFVYNLLRSEDLSDF